MNVRIALLAAPLALLAACSDDDPTIHTLSSGTYAVSGASIGTATPGDQCNLLESYTVAGKEIAIGVDGTTATFDLKPPSVAIMNPTATINGNALEAPVEANYTIQYPAGGNCLVRVRRTVVGDLTGTDAAALQLHASIQVEEYGSGCDGTPYTGIGCQSDIHFLANKVVAQ
jgi:hypothetical protein